MGKRKTIFIVGEIYHIYNRGVDKRPLFEDHNDADRFWKSILEFNTQKPIGSIYERSFEKDKKKDTRIVEFIAFNILTNHYHFILRPLKEKAIEKFMQRFGTGYTNYFNEKHKRSGSLFQGPFKSVYVTSDSQLRHLSAYVNLNDKIHQLGSEASKLGLRSSWAEYAGGVGNVSKVGRSDSICEKSIILEHFRSKKGYKKFAEETVEDIVRRRKEDEGLDKLLID